MKFKIMVTVVLISLLATQPVHADSQDCWPIDEWRSGPQKSSEWTPIS